MDYDEFYDKVFEYVAIGQNAVVNCYYPDRLKRRIIDTALEVEKVLESKSPKCDELCDKIIEYEWERRTEEEMKQKRLSHDNVEYVALLDEEKKVLIDGEKLEDFIRDDPGEYFEIENHVELMKDIFEEGDDNEIQTENGTPYEVFWSTYMGHYIIVERRIEL